MWNKGTKTSIALILVLSSIGRVVQGDTAETSALNSLADLDLSGEIVYAINFGNNGNPNVGGIVFSQDQEHSAITLDVLGEGLSTGWGPPPGTNDAGLNQVMNGQAFRYGTAPLQISIDVGGVIIGNSYLLQIIGYEPEDHDRNIDFIVENEEIVTGFNPLAQQGGVVGEGGYVIKYEFIAGDPILNIRMLSHVNAVGVCGLILTDKSAPIPFTDFGSGTTTQLFAGGAVWQLNWGQGPWTWSTITGEPLLDSNVSAVLDLLTTAAADVSADLVATLPIAGTLTLTAHDEHFPEVTTGTMVLSGAGINVIDINASRVIVDEGSGMFLAPFHPPGPKVTLALEEATGIFGHITQVGPWELSLAGSYAIPLIEGLELQDNIFTALGGNVALIGGIGEFTLSGLYNPDPAKLPIDFCQYGTATTKQLAPDGGGWDQQWGLAGPLDWLECTVETNVPFLNENVTGNLTTQVIGLPDINEDLILHIPLAGQQVMTEHAAGNPDEVIGQITCDVIAMFVADMNAVNAVVDEAAGTITIAFGASVEEGPDGLMTVIETTGSLADIKQVSPWEWHVNGTMQIARVPELSVQDNLLAALQQAELLLGAEEEFTLTGSYYRSLPEE